MKSFLAFAITIGCLPALAQSVELVNEFSVTTQSSQPGISAPVVLNNTLFFFADDGIHGHELWRSDGTEAGTTLIKDINSSTESSISGYHQLITSGNLVYFVAIDGNSEVSGHGHELWRSDGTEIGTVLVKDFEEGINGSFFRSMTDINGALFLWVNGQIWKTNGNQDSTILIATAVEDQILFTANGYLFFTKRNEPYESGLWKSDGTPEGTVLFMQNARPLTATGNTLFIEQRIGDDIIIWKSDGTKEGTSIFRKDETGNFVSADKAFTVENNIFFNGDFRPSSGEQIGLWKYNKTKGEFVFLKDRLNGQEFINLNGILIFSGTDYHHHTELWRSDGSPEGTYMIKKIHPNESSNVYHLQLFQGEVYFSAGPYGNVEFWKTNGTEQGTVAVKDIKEEGSSNSSFYSALNNSLLFMADDGTHGTELWKTQGTTESTLLVKDINPLPNKLIINNVNVVEGNVYISIEDERNKWELWKNSVSEGTQKLKDFFELTSEYENIGERLFFSGSTSNDYEIGLWKTDGTNEGTFEIDTIKKQHYSSPQQLTKVGKLLYFSASPGDFLWKTDGTNEGTSLVLDENGNYLEDPTHLINVNGTLYFGANSRGSGDKLYKSDGTQAGTQLVKDINSSEYISGSFENFVHVGNILYFVGFDGEAYRFWRSNGTPEGTQVVNDILPKGLAAIDSFLYYSTNDSDTPVQGNTVDYAIWKSDGSEKGTFLLDSIRSVSAPANFIGYKNGIFFMTDRNLLYKNEGTYKSTKLVKDLQEISHFSHLSSYALVNNTLFFRIEKDSSRGFEIWKTDGTTEGTVQAVAARQNYHYFHLPHDKEGIYYVDNAGTDSDVLWKLKVENEPPKIDKISDQVLSQGDTLTFSFHVYDKETNVGSLEVSVFSSVEEIIAAKDIAIQSTDTVKIISVISKNDKIGASIVTIQVSDGIASVEHSFKVTVVPKSMDFSPGIRIVGDTVYCEGDSTQLIAPEGFSAYQWSNGDSTQQIVVNTTGQYTVEVKDILGRKSNPSKVVNINVVPYPDQPHITFNTNPVLCKGDSVILDAPAGYAGYKWTDGSSTQNIIVKTAGTYQVKVFNENGCESENSISVEISQNNFEAFITEMAGVITATEGVQYAWYIDTEKLPQTTQSIEVDKSGTYYAVVTDQAGCDAISNEIILQITGIEDFNEVSVIHIFPNPSKSGLFKINIPVHLMGASVWVIAESGQIVYHGAMYNTSLQIDMHDQTDGIYLFLLDTGEKIIGKRLIK